MAEIEKLKLELKIFDLDSFKELVEALGAWADEAAAKGGARTSAEDALFAAATKIVDQEST